MPTFTTIALQNLLEHRNPSTNSSTLKSQQPSTNKSNYIEENDEEAKEEEKLKARKRLNHIYISPALYTTPEPTPILDYPSSGSVSSSPYVFNRKGRGGGNSANRRVDGFEVQGSGAQSGGNEGEALLHGEDEVVESSLIGGGAEIENCGKVEDEGVDDDDDFVDPRGDLFSVASSSDLNDSRRLGLDNMSVVSNQIGEFYDAIEDFSSDGSMLTSPSCSRNIESELHTTRLSLIEEIEKRKIAEHNLATMRTQWKKITKILLSQTGSMSLETPTNDGSCLQFDIDEMKQVSQEVVFARFVAEAMGKAEAQAEAELAAELVVGSKDKEISRLKDRLQYYEAMIHEMSQKNLESMEVARRQRDRKRGHRKWLWSCIGTSIVIGASVIAYSYAPTPQSVSDAQPESTHD